MCRGCPVEDYYDTRWQTGLSSTQTKVEGIVLKAAWHWGSDSSVVNDPLPSAWGSVDGGRIFSPISWKGSLTGNSERYERMNQPSALETEHLSPVGPRWGNMERGSFTGKR